MSPAASQTPGCARCQGHRQRQPNGIKQLRPHSQTVRLLQASAGELRALYAAASAEVQAANALLLVKSSGELDTAGLVSYQAGGSQELARLLLRRWLTAGAAAWLCCREPGAQIHAALAFNSLAKLAAASSWAVVALLRQQCPPQVLHALCACWLPLTGSRWQASCRST